MGSSSRFAPRVLTVAVTLTLVILSSSILAGDSQLRAVPVNPFEQMLQKEAAFFGAPGDSRQTPAQPMRVQLTEIGSIWMSYTQVSDVVVDGNYAYAVGATPGFMVFNVSNPMSPQRIVWLRSTTEFSYGGQLLKAGSLLYVIGGTAQVQIMDVSNPLNPVPVGTFTPPSGHQYQSVTGAAIDGQYLYVAVRWWDSGLEDHGDLLIVDVSNPAVPVLVGSLTGVGMTYALATAGDYVLIGKMSYYQTSTDALVIVNVSSPTSPYVVGALPTSTTDTSGSVYDIEVVGDRAYLVILNRGLAVVDITDPSAPAFVNVLSSEYGGFKLDMAGTMLYMTKIASGAAISALDISNPDSPTRLGEITAAGSFWRLDIQGSHLFVASAEDGLRVVDVSIPSAMSIVGQWSTGGEPVAVAVSGNHAYLANGHYGLSVLDITNPAEPDTVGKYSVTGTANDIEVVGSMVYVADYLSLYAFDVSNPAAPTATWANSTDGDPMRLAVSGNYLYSATLYGGLYVYDISVPQIPVRVGRLNTLGETYDIAVQGSTAYVADYTNGLLILDITYPESPAILGRYIVPQDDWVNRVTVSGHHAFVADYNAGLIVLDVSIPDHPALVTSLPLYNVNDLMVSGDLLYVAQFQNLQVFDISNPASPVLVGLRQAEARGVDMESGMLFTAGFPGLSVLSVSDYFCGDVDNSLAVPDIGDLTYLVDYLFQSGPPPSNPSAGNVDGIGSTDISDLTVFVDYLFFGQGTLNCQ
ncbi:MAG: hypothetical protein AB1644_06935 [Candidatus Zixiibacteriota bacterium]